MLGHFALMENQAEKNMEREMDTKYITQCENLMMRAPFGLR